MIVLRLLCSRCARLICRLVGKLLAMQPPQTEEMKSAMLKGDAQYLDIGEAIKLEPDQPQSPCFVMDLPRMPDSERRDCDKALIACQKMMVDRYCKLAIKGVFQIGVGVEPIMMLTENTLYHPIQDPAGGLFIALLIVRRNRPTGPVFDSSGQLCLKTRRHLASIASVSHKTVAHGAGVGMHLYVKYIVEQFLTPLEWPKWEADWGPEHLSHHRCEYAVLSEPLLSLSTTNPLTEAEIEVGRLLDGKKLSFETATLFRGSAFFLLAACFFEEGADVMEKLSARMSTEQIGKGCVSLMLTLLHVSKTQPGDSAVSKGKLLHRAPYGADADVAAQNMLRCARLESCAALRAGPYRAQIHWQEKSHPVQQLLCPENLDRATRVFDKSM